MPRANRYFVPEKLYHLTHRCHDRQFLFKFARERDRYRHLAWSSLKAFPDRYHCTMIEDGPHLWNGMVYIDLNMVRAGVVSRSNNDTSTAAGILANWGGRLGVTGRSQGCSSDSLEARFGQQKHLEGLLLTLSKLRTSSCSHTSPGPTPFQPRSITSQGSANPTGRL